ncbi:diguanylate cyclase [Gammaproteobacteria bacterium]
MEVHPFTILVVDDNAHNRFTLCTLLNRLQDCRVIEAASGEEALVRTIEQPIHLILLDVQMPGMDGFETARHLGMTERTRHIPVVFVTAVFKAEAFVQRGYQVGAVDYLTKPIDDNLLLNRVKSYRTLFDREQLITQSLSQLKVSEQRLTYALEATLDGLWDWDIASDTLYLSPRFETMLGAPLGTIPHTRDGLFSRLHPDEAERVTAAYYALADGTLERMELEHRLRTADDRWLWVLARGKVVEREWRRGSTPPGTGKSITGSALRVVGTIVDITARIAAEKQLRLSAAVIEHMSDALVILEPDETIHTINPAFTRATGYGATEARGRPISLLKSGRHDKQFFAAMRRSLQESGHWKGEIWNRRANGECYPEWLNVTILRNDKGEIGHYVCIYSDLSTQEHVRNRLHHLAYYDTLTGLANREMFHDRLTGAIAGAAREQRQVAVILIDLDRFKDINDNLGHDVGDDLLNEAAIRLQGCVQSGDTVARLGGDEFAVVLPHVPDANSVATVADQIRGALHTPFDFSGRPLYVSASIGISLYPQDGDSLETLVRNADLALYQAKERGRNNYQFCSPELTEVAQERFRVATDLRLAIERNEFRLYFQPLLNMERGLLVGAEVLIRWQPPNVGLIAPGRFLPVAEEAGLMTAIDAWVLRAACQQVMEWQKQGFVLPRIAVNLSASVIERNDLVDSIRRVLEETGLPPQRLELEVSEGFIMARTEHAVSALDCLRQMGVELAIDDFGTGYSSLSYLKRLPLNHLKIDQSFVRDLPEDNHDASIARAIIALGKSLGLRIIAEGIEKTEQWDFLRAEGCDEGQGYLLGRPMAVEQFLEWVEKYQAEQRRIP